MKKDDTDTIKAMEKKEDGEKEEEEEEDDDDDESEEEEEEDEQAGGDGKNDDPEEKEKKKKETKEEREQFLNQFRTSRADLEKLVGIRLFPNLDDLKYVPCLPGVVNRIK